MKDIDIIIGSIINSYVLSDPKTCILTTNNGNYTILVDDDSCGGNDSYAWVDKVKIDNIIGQKIIKAYHKDRDNCGVILIIETELQEGFIEIIHEHNGYYGFSYEVVK